MKKIVLLLLITIISFSCKDGASSKIDKEKLQLAKERDYNMTDGAPVMEFDKLEHDFGVINEGDVVETIFSFKNTGKSALIITNASSSCGCTIPNYPRQPIAPGDSGEITVKFNSSGKPNMQTKTVTLVTNTPNGRENVVIKAEVTPKQKPKAS